LGELVVAVYVVRFHGDHFRFAHVAAVGIVGTGFGHRDILVPISLQAPFHVIIHGRKLAFQRLAGGDGGVVRRSRIFDVAFRVARFWIFVQLARHGQQAEREYRDDESCLFHFR